MEVDAEANFVRSCSLCSRRRTRGRGGTLANFSAERGAGKSKKKQEFSIANKLKKQEKSKKTRAGREAGAAAGGHFEAVWHGYGSPPARTHARTHARNETISRLRRSR